MHTREVILRSLRPTNFDPNLTISLQIISAFLMGKITKTFTEDQLMKISPILLASGYLLLVSS